MPNDPQDNVLTYAITVGSIFAIIAVGVVCDIILVTAKEPSVSMLLREHPGLFFVPVGLLIVMLFILAVHLWS